MGVLGCLWPWACLGVVVVGGFWRFPAVLRSGWGVGSGCISAVGFILCGCPQSLAPDMPSGP